MKKNYQKKYEKALERASRLYRAAYVLAEADDNEEMKTFRLGRLALIYDVMKNGFGLTKKEIQELEKTAIAESTDISSRIAG